ncbi:glutathione S-transferase 1 isoform X2 [Anoplophora glabripennis]|uniref:glutathione S-transferase 1 isoform X2 n=1 Tax=Anoplophora glabripennis TaxID=217634 RepID=UPI0008757D56|nr:glutathione S-transferase 1 isoform X2 [Anoplophora glabripennis]
MVIKLYGVKGSPPVRATLLTLEALGIEVDFKVTNILKGEQYTQDFLEMNPLHTVPTIQDGDFVIWDSHAINSYLVEKYGKDDSLYPKDLEARAVVNQRMYFDNGILFPRWGAAVLLILKQGAKTVRKDLADSLVDAYNSLETLLERSTYVAGEQVTIADFSIVTTLTSANVLVPVASNRFPKISEWLVKMQALPYYASANQVGLDQFAAVVKSKLA